jgi:hypothetical protein
MARNKYEGTTEYNGRLYAFSAIVDKPDEITTLTITGEGLEKFVAAHGILLSEPIDWNNPQVRDDFLAKTVLQNVKFQTTIGRQVHEKVMRELNTEI